MVNSQRQNTGSVMKDTVEVDDQELKKHRASWARQGHFPAGEGNEVMAVLGEKQRCHGGWLSQLAYDSSTG